MKAVSLRILVPVLTLFVALLFTAGCGGSQGGGSHDSIDSTPVVKVEPQDFPVNALADSLFGKAMAVTEQAGLKATVTNLAPMTEPLPAWLDQIVSRESIVMFASGILKDMPEEVEFVQSSSNHYDAGNGLKVFVVNFSTRPSGASIVTFGGYLDEDRSYWASQVSKEKLELNLKGAQAMATGVELHGEWAGAKAVPFKATLTRNSGTLVNGK